MQKNHVRLVVLVLAIFICFIGHEKAEGSSRTENNSDQYHEQKLASKLPTADAQAKLQIGNDHTENDAAKEKERSSAQPFPWPKRTELVKPEWVSAEATVAYTVFAGFTLWQIWRQSKLAANAQRAWIVTNARLGELDDYAKQGLPETMNVVLSVENVGHSPARIKRAHVRAVILKELPARPTYAGEEVAAVASELIGPGKKRLVVLPLEKTAFSNPELLTLLARRELTIYFWGVVEYEDNSAKNRATHFGYFHYTRSDKLDPRPESMYRLESKKYNYSK